MGAEGPMTRTTKVVVALLVVFIIAVISAAMYGVTTFLFHFSGGQARMGPVVDYGAIVVITVSLVIAAIVWKRRSPTAAAIYAAVGTPAAWVVAVFIEWCLSFVLGAG
jgi:hypothetical protein